MLNYNEPRKRVYECLIIQLTNHDLSMFTKNELNNPTRYSASAGFNLRLTFISIASRKKQIIHNAVFQTEITLVPLSIISLTHYFFFSSNGCKYGKTFCNKILCAFALGCKPSSCIKLELSPTDFRKDGTSVILC